jgi:hypothetical protein
VLLLPLSHPTLVELPADELMLVDACTLSLPSLLPPDRKVCKPSFPRLPPRLICTGKAFSVLQTALKGKVAGPAYVVPFFSRNASGGLFGVYVASSCPAETEKAISSFIAELKTVASGSGDFTGPKTQVSPTFPLMRPPLILSYRELLRTSELLRRTQVPTCLPPPRRVFPH